MAAFRQGVDVEPEGFAGSALVSVFVSLLAGVELLELLEELELLEPPLEALLEP